MRLITSNNNDCVAASIAMLVGVDINYIQDKLFVALPKPFPNPWAELPKVPDMNVICDWLWYHYQIALTPFEYDPLCTPHKDCPPVSVYPRTISGQETFDSAFDRQMRYGPGLIEGLTADAKGHMCAWDGRVIYDPRGYCFSYNVASEKFDYFVSRFWLATKGKTL